MPLNILSLNCVVSDIGVVSLIRVKNKSLLKWHISAIYGMALILQIIKGGMNFMYLSKVSDDVRKLMNKLDKQDDFTKLKFLLYVFGLLNNNQINDKNEVNPDLVEDELTIFNMNVLGFPNGYCDNFLLYLMSIYNYLTTNKDAYEDNGNIIGVEYTEVDKKLMSSFEKLSYNEKLDIYAELFIRYDNDTYFSKKITIITLDQTGYLLARKIEDLKIKDNK